MTKIENGKFYKTRGGLKAVVYAVNQSKTKPTHGAVLYDGEYHICAWDPEGYRFDGKLPDHFDLRQNTNDKEKLFQYWSAS